MKDAESTGDLVESRKPPAGDGNACAGLSVSGHERNTAHPQQLVRMGIEGVDDGGDQYEPEDVDFAASLLALFPVDAVSFAVGVILAPRYDFDRLDWVFDDELSQFR